MCQSYLYVYANGVAFNQRVGKNRLDLAPRLIPRQSSALNQIKRTKTLGPILQPHKLNV